ncbi:MAG: ABC transporter substrate-binding protein [Actinomycetota bacterium]|nr:ABC transporter substrate-binding protein [Actinomycetota bacterium]
MTTDSTTAQRVFAVLLALALSAAACSSGDDGSGDTAADASGESDNGDLAGSGLDVGEGESVAPTIAAPQEEAVDVDEIRQGGVLVVAMEAESDGLNPVANNFATPGGTMGRAIFDPLFVMDADGRPVPYLAAGAEPVEGTTSWQIFLREGVMFHDGNEMTADDLLVGFEAQLADPIISLAVAPSFPPENRVERIDDYTVQFNLLRKTAHFPANLASQLGMVPSAEYIAAAAEDETLNQMPIGQGPFRIVSRAQDDRTVVERFDGYWQGSDTVYLDGIEFLPITDTALAAERIAAGDIDMVSTTNPDAILTLRDAAGVDTIENVFSSEGFIMMNTRSAPFDDIRVRQALTYATDRELYASLISQGTSPLADSMFHPSLIWNNPDVVQEGNMPELAGPLVESYCADMPENCTDSRVNMELQYSGPSVVATRIADVLSADWEPFFNVTEQELLQDAHILEVAIGQFQVVTWGQFGSIEPDNEVVWLECATAEGFITINWVRWCNPDRDALLYEQRAIDDLDRRVEIWREIQAEMNESYAYIFTTHTNWTIGHREEVRGICRQTAPGGEPLFCNSGGLVQFNQIWLTDG